METNFKNSIIILLLLFGLVKSAWCQKKLIEGYRTLKNPKFDSTIIGRKFDLKDEVVQGKGTSYFNKYKGLDVKIVSQSNEIQSKVDVTLKKILSATLGLNALTDKDFSIKGITTYECQDYTKINNLGKKNTYVVSAIMVNEIEISNLTKVQGNLKARIDSALLKNIGEANVDVKVNNNRVSFKKGSGLIVAVKVMEISESEVITLQTLKPQKSSTLIIDNDNNFGYYQVNEEKLGLQFLPWSLNIIDTTTFKTPLSERSNAGCFILKVTGTEGQGGEYHDLTGPLVVIPIYKNMMGDIKPAKADYAPYSDFLPGGYRVVCANDNKEKINIYTIQITDLKAWYGSPPNPSVNHSTWAMEKAVASIVTTWKQLKYKIVS